MLLTGSVSIQNLKLINGNELNTYKEVCAALGLLESDGEWDALLSDTAYTMSSHKLRNLLGILLIFCELANAMELLEKHHTHWSDDFLRTHPDRNVHFQKVMILLDFEAFLLSHSRFLKLYALPEISYEDRAFIHNLKNRVAVEAVINEELQHDLAQLKSTVVNDFGDNGASLNSKQREFCGHIINCLKKQEQCCVFLCARGETGKTHALKSLLAATRSLEENIVTVALAVVSSGISATDLNGGRTAHSRFKIPLQIHETSSLNIPYQSALARLIRVSKVIVWEEAP